MTREYLMSEGLDGKLHLVAADGSILCGRSAAIKKLVSVEHGWPERSCHGCKILLGNRTLAAIKHSTAPRLDLVDALGAVAV
jgi:hypothetical protein